MGRDGKFLDQCHQSLYCQGERRYVVLEQSCWFLIQITASTVEDNGIDETALACIKFAKSKSDKLAGIFSMARYISLSGQKCNKLTVALHVDSEVVSRGLISILSSASNRYEIVRSKSLDGRLKQVKNKPLDVVILTCSDKQMEGAQEAAKCFRGTGAKVLLLLSEINDELFKSVAKISTDGFLLLDELTTETLDEALQKVAAGDMFIPPQIAERLLVWTRGEQGEPRPVLPELTPRERQALQLLVGGLSNKQIATRLRISSHGAKRLVANVMAKLNCQNRTMAVSMALQHRLVEQDVTEDA